jgi:hypothetical protein
MPAGLSSIVEKTVENGGLRNFLLLALGKASF